MTTLTASERGDLAERMLPIACQLIGIVHGDGDAHDIAYALGDLDRQELYGLIVALAALGSSEQSLAEALAFVTWDEQGRTADPEPVRGTVRQHARVQWPPATGAKPAQGLTKRAQAVIQDTAELVGQGLSRQEIAGRLGFKDWNSVTVAHRRAGLTTPEVAA